MVDAVMKAQFIRVLIVDENALFRRGLVSLLNDCPDFLVTGEVTSVQEITAQEAELQPHVVIVDIQTKKPNGSQELFELRRMFPNSRLLVLTSSVDQKHMLKAMEDGARGYLLKDVDLKELVEALRLIARRDAILFPSEISGTLFNSATSRKCRKTSGLLSPREMQVLTLVAQGSSNKEIAEACHLSETTIKAHVRRILDKLDVKNRAQAVGLAIDAGLLSTKNRS
ncbi:MAG: response regulator transcription factor [Chloroflexi bacterium]|nr:response regulator transcription factor [Chloroflexota bacterium]